MSSRRPPRTTETPAGSVSSRVLTRDPRILASTRASRPATHAPRRHTERAQDAKRSATDRSAHTSGRVVRPDRVSRGSLGTRSQPARLRGAHSWMPALDLEAGRPANAAVAQDDTHTLGGPRTHRHRAPRGVYACIPVRDAPTLPSRRSICCSLARSSDTPPSCSHLAAAHTLTPLPCTLR